MYSTQFKIFALSLTAHLSAAQETSPLDTSSLSDAIFGVPQSSAPAAWASAFYASALHDLYSELSLTGLASIALATPIASYIAGLGPYGPDISLSDTTAASTTDSGFQALSSSYPGSDSDFAAATSGASSPLQASSSLDPASDSSFAAATSDAASPTGAPESALASITSRSATRTPATAASATPSFDVTRAVGLPASSRTAEAVGSRSTAAVVGFGAALAGVFGVMVLL